MKDNWNVKTTKELCEKLWIGLVTTMTKNYVEKGIPLIRNSDIKENRFLEDLIKLDPKFAKEHLSRTFKTGDVATIHTGEVGTSAVIPEWLDGAHGFATINSRLNLKYVIPLYYSYYLNSSIFKKQVYSVITGDGRSNLNLYDFINLKVDFPPLPQQRKIVKILSTCDEVIDKTEAAIAKYQAIKQGMMHDLFTRGINLTAGKLRPKYEDAPELYKESELGMIPREWKVESIINTTYLKGRIGWQGLKADEFIEHGPFLVTGTDFYEGVINWSDCYHVSEERYQEAKYIQLTNDDVLITKDGTIGKTAYVNNCPEKAVLNSGIFLLRCKNDLYKNRFMFHMLNSSVFDNYLYKTLGGSTIVHLYQREFEKFLFPLPDKNEQEVIIDTIDTIIKKIQNEQTVLTKYQQLKSGLMQDLLNGRVEVSVGEEE